MGRQQQQQQHASRSALFHATSPAPASVKSLDALFIRAATFIGCMMAFWALILPGSWRVGLVPGYAEWLLSLPTDNVPVPRLTTVRFQDYPSIRFLHVLPSALWAALLPIQLASQSGALPLARRHHRILGRLFLAAAASLLLGYLLMEYHFVGLPEALFGRVALRASAAWFVLSASLAWRAVRAGDVRGHHAWAARHFAAGGWVAVQRCLVMVSGPLLPGMFDTPAAKEAGFQACAIAAMVLSVGAVELYLALRERRLRESSATKAE